MSTLIVFDVLRLKERWIYAEDICVDDNIELRIYGYKETELFNK